MENIFFILVIIYIFGLLQLRLRWNRNYPYDLDTPIEGASTDVTVVIAVRNEEKNIPQLIQSLKNQTYKYINFIIVDDHSTDQSYTLLQSFESERLKVYRLPSKLSGKKQAIRLAVEKAKTKLIITTDADCLHHQHWVNRFVSAHRLTGAKMISGPVRFQNGNSLWEKILNVEFSSLIITGAASIRRKRANMCNAANLCFERKAFLSQNNYKEHAHIPTGDDEFFLHQLARNNPNQIIFLKNKESIVNTPPPNNLKTFIEQRVRWASKWKHYKNRGPQLTSIFIFLFHLFFYLSAASTFFFNGNLMLFFVTFMLRIGIELYYLKGILKWQGDQNNLWLVPIISIFYPLYAVIIGLMATFSNYTWKDRKFSV
ncbi:glycosyltransferase [Flammeovirga agarivorans]|uniref:Glycosyltransferase n=1 Tax=Flammeovirga agarivorans TaxID=2726742 RepID=A0A7X8XUJ7_9BACT|nr:glycosyltransferase [Flammeovirga agarivorans]NLR90423.1 glycosyltransferase [Flammeovirga agarivorans]